MALWLSLVIHFEPLRPSGSSWSVVYRAQGSNSTTFPPLHPAGTGVMAAQWHNPVSKHRSGNPSRFLLSSQSSGDNKARSSAGEPTWSLAFSLSPCCLWARHPLQHIHCITFFSLPSFFHFLASLRVNSSPSASLSSQLSEFLHSSLYSRYEALSLFQVTPWSISIPQLCHLPKSWPP